MTDCPQSPDRWGTQPQRGAAIEAARAEGNLSRANFAFACKTLRMADPHRHPMRWIVGTFLVGMGAALVVTRRQLREERLAHEGTLMALETIKQVTAPRDET